MRSLSYNWDAPFVWDHGVLIVVPNFVLEILSMQTMNPLNCKLEPIMSDNTVLSTVHMCGHCGDKWVWVDLKRLLAPRFPIPNTLRVLQT